MQRKRSFVVAIVIFGTLCHLLPLLTAQASPRPLCNGVFDLYFVLDSSGSVGTDTYRKTLVPFVEQVIGHYSQSGFRIAILTFDLKYTIWLHLTPISNATAVSKALNSLKGIQLGYDTILSPALTEVNNMITTGLGNDITSIILIVTDGGLSHADSHDAQLQAQTARDRGTTIFSIGVGIHQNAQQLRSLSGSVDRVFTADNYNSLNQILDHLVDDICIEITEPNTTVYNTQPLTFCRGDFPKINITGAGFDTLNGPYCNFSNSAGLNTSTSAPNYTDSTISCPTPMTGNYTGELIMQVVSRNNKYKENTTTLIIEDCRKLIQASPSHWCLSELTEEVNISGVALTDGLNQNKAVCKFITEDGGEYTTRPVNMVTYDKITCPTNSSGTKNVTLKGNVSIRISLDGAVDVPNPLRVRIDEFCTTVQNITPLRYCRGQSPTIKISGSRFNMLYRPFCHFWTPTGREYRVDAVATDHDTLLSCPVPASGHHIGDLYVQVTTPTNYKEKKATLVIEDCRKLNAVSPDHWCISEDIDSVIVSGRAMTDGLNQTNVHCKFILQNGEEHITYPDDEVTENEISCPTQSIYENFTLNGVVMVKVSLDGVTYVPNSVTIKINSCGPMSYAFIAGIAGGLFALLALLACCLLWCLFPLITGVIVGGPVEDDEEPIIIDLPAAAPPTPVPPVVAPKRPGRKWSIVDTSYYGIRGAGGIRPVKVKWGNKGTTEEGAKLRRGTDAAKLGEVEVAGPPVALTTSLLTESSVETEDDETGYKQKCSCKLCCLFYCWRCCGVFTDKIKRCYTVISSYRPVFTYHGTLGKKVLCCPGPNIEEKLYATKKSNTTPAVPQERSVNHAASSASRKPFRNPPRSGAQLLLPLTEH